MESGCDVDGALSRGPLVTWGCEDMPGHALHTHVALARHAADLLQCRYDGRLEDFCGEELPYCIPRGTLCGAECRQVFASARPDPRRFLGGWVPARLLATKAIVHPLAPGEEPPDGWPTGFAEAARDIVLDGATAFTAEGAARAGEGLLAKGPVRVKAVGASGGSGQFVARSAGELDQVLARAQDDGLIAGGLVLEEHLEDAKTYSVGEIVLGDLSAAYVGLQETTDNNHGERVYGGSRLFLVRGRSPQLLKLVSPEVATLCLTGLRFDQLAEREFGLVASRRNYDVIVGTDHGGRRRCAVLEQSWRVGGASPAELVALEAFAKDPARRHAVAASVERYGATAVPPVGARLYFHGTDAAVGPMLKYAVVQGEER